jgi:hypothetical protein
MQIHDRRKSAIRESFPASRNALILILLATAGLALIECVAILILNQGTMTLTIDDPYIHFALGNRLLDGHYGINAHEYAAPSSSIVWPFLICALTINNEILPLATVAINTIITLGCMACLWSALTSHEAVNNDIPHPSTVHTFVILLTCLAGSNLITLIFTGLEHNLQALVSGTMVLGMLKHTVDKKVRWWWLASIVVAPLVRYECAALSFLNLVYIACQGRPGLALVIGAITASPLLAFSIFLKHLGLDLLPSSILVKTNMHEGHSGLSTATHNLLANLGSFKGLVMGAGIAVVVAYACQQSTPKRLRMAALMVAGAAAAHMALAQLGFRYEAYVWVSIMTLTLFTQAPKLHATLNRVKAKPFTAGHVIGASSMIILIICGLRFTPYLAATPFSANNIYKQQYQMRRFALEYLKEPVAVNDLGYVSYKNNFEVLDLWGLGSLEAAKARGSNAPDWMAEITTRHDVRLAMIYESWFPTKIPKSWIKIADLKSTRNKLSQIVRVGPAEDDVSFYATDCNTAQRTFAKLEAFQRALPAGSSVEIHPEAARACHQRIAQVAVQEAN